MSVEQYIFEHISETTRISNGKDADLIDLPKPYTVPSIKDSFQEMYYWDTYFTNKALMLTNNSEQAINNLENFSFLIDKFGYIPNGTRTPLLNRSQPPFFGLAIKDVYNLLSVEQKHYFISKLKQEYQFWINNRTTENGLAHYDVKSTDSEYIAFTYFYEKRVGVNTIHTAERGRDILAEAESGWDFSPRYPNGCTKYNSIDLNCLLYANELFLSEYDENDKDIWSNKAKNRKQQIMKFNNKNGIYFDYDTTNRDVSNLYCCACFFPYFVGVSKDKEGFRALLSKLEYKFGVVSALTEHKGFQWATPNGWAPLFYVCVSGAINVGDNESAIRIAKKYIDMIDRIFHKTGCIYEKYNVITGEIGIGEEYGTPEMLGWTAGIYLSFKQFLSNGKLI